MDISFKQSEEKDEKGKKIHNELKCGAYHKYDVEDAGKQGWCATKLDKGNLDIVNTEQSSSF